MKFKSMALAILASTVSTLAMADLSWADLSDPGDALLLVDSRSNVAWLGLTPTLGLSVDQVAAAGWFDRGFKLATQAQLDSLISQSTYLPLLSMLIGPVPSPVPGDATWPTSLAGAIAGEGGQFLVKALTYGPVLRPPSDVHVTTPGDRGWYIDLPDQPVNLPSTLWAHEILSTTSAIWLSSQDSSPGVGVFLVKDLSAVPEPTTWLLMGLGLVALSIARSRHRPG